MKKSIVFLLFFIILSTVVWGQTTYTWIGNLIPDYEWADSDNWDRVPPATPETFPGEDDDDAYVVFNSAESGTHNFESGITIATLEINTELTAKFTAPGDFFNVDDLLILNDNFALSEGTINIQNLTVGADGEFPAANAGSLRMNGAPIIVSSTEVIINPSANVVIGNITAPNHDIIINSSNGNVTITGNITGGEINLTASGGNIIINGNITGSQVSVSGTSTINADITTTATQVYGAVTLGGAGHTLTGSTVTLGNITGGGFSLTIAGNAVLNGGNVDSLQITGDAVFQTASLTAGSVSVTGDAEFQAALSAASVVVTGNSEINANITTTATQVYGTVTLGGAGTRTLTGTTVTLGAITGGAIPLTIAGNAVLNGGAVGALQINGNAVFQTAPLTAGSVNVTGTAEFQAALSAADVSVTGNSVINANVTTTATQVYGTVTLGGAGTRTLTGTTVTLGAITGGGFSLTVDGNAVLNGGNVGALQVTGNARFQTALLTAGSVSVTGNAEFQSALNATSVSIAGTSSINAGVAIHTTGSQTYSGAITLTGTGDIELVSDSGSVSTGAGITGTTVTTGTGLSISAGSDINLTNSINARNIILRANGDVTITGIGNIVAGDVPLPPGLCDYAVPNVVIYIKADSFVSSGFTGIITPGTSGVLCLDVNTSDLDSAKVNGSFHIHTPPVHLIYSESVPPDLASLLYDWVNPLTDNSTSFTVQPGSNIYIVDVGENLNGEITFIVDGNGYIEIRGSYKAPGLILTPGIGGVNLVGADIELTTGPFSSGGRQVTLRTPASSITAPNITLGAITANGNSLTLTGNAVLNGATGLQILTVTGNSTINADISSTGAQTYTGSVTLGNTANPLNLTANSGSLITFGSTVTGTNNSRALAVTNANVIFNGAVSSLASIAVGGGGSVTINAGTITTTTGGQTYSGTVNLGANVNFTGNANTLISFENIVNGVFDLTVTTANVQFNNTVTSNNLNVTSGRTILNGDITINAGAITFNQLETMSGGTVTINNSALYTQNGVVTASGIFSQTGSGDVSLSGNITATSPVRANAKLSFSSEITLVSDVVFTVPSTGGFVDLMSVVMSNSRQLSFAGGTETETLEISQTPGTLGNITIKEGSYAVIKSGIAITQNDGRTLSLERDAVLDISAGSWHIGAGALTSDDFAGVNGTLTLGTQSKLTTSDLNLTGSTFTVNNSGWATIAVKGDLDVSAVNFNNANLPRLIFEMIGNGTQSLNAQRIGSLHIKPGSRTNLSGDLEILGEVEIKYRNIPAGPFGVLNAGSHNIIMYSGLSETKNLNGTNTTVSVGRWRIIDAPESISSAVVTTYTMNAFLQDEDAGIEFKRASPSGRSFFEIIGNTVWQKFKCTEGGVVFQFSTHPDQHIFTNTFEIRGSAGNPITLTRYIDPSDLTKTGWRYIYDNNYMPPGAVDGAPVDNSLPTVPAPSNLKGNVNEVIKFWNFNLVTTGFELTPLMDISYADIYFSHAWNQTIQISSQQMNLKAVPFYRASGTGGNPPRTGCFNYGWIEIRKIIYSFVEDSNGNGKVDRIRVQTSMPLNGIFTGFRVSVEGYTVRGTDGYEMVDVRTGDSDDIYSFYIYLEEKSPYLYDGQPLSWRVTQNDSLKDTTSQPFLVGDPRDGEIFVTINTIPPRISYALTLPGHDETYVRMSQPVTGALIVGGNANDFTVQQTAPPPDYELDRFTLSETLPAFGALSYRLKLDSNPSVSDLANLARIGDVPVTSFTMQGLMNFSVRAIDWSDELADPAAYMYYPSPRYPKDWNYSEYAEYAGNGHIDGLSPDDDESLKDEIFIPPYQLLTPEMMRMLEDYATGDISAKVTPSAFSGGGNIVTRRSTDVLVSRPLEDASSDDYFALPEWARHATDSGGSSPDPLNAMGTVWEFNGTKFLEESDDDITLQARILNITEFNGLNLRLFYGFNVPAEDRNPAEGAVSGRNSGGLWLPRTSVNPFFNIVPSETVDFDTGLLGFYSGGGSSSSLTPVNHLVEFNIPANSFSSGGKVEFFFRLEGDPSADPNLFIARLDAPPGVVPSNWFELVRPFSFDIQNVRRQRGGVTILNNVINPVIGDVTYLRYSLVRPGRVTIQVYTLDGTLVKSLVRNEQRAAGEWTESWNGTNNGGNPVARGMYFIRVVGPDIDEIRKVMVIR
ncbi:MAG: hypothetical protein LBI28_13395 [Treponema sp.]|jgi:hypothetical protein|nr:hypothetical protein [Treponema sp.]